MPNESLEIVDDNSRFASTEKDDEGRAVRAVSQLDVRSLSRGEVGMIKQLGLGIDFSAHPEIKESRERRGDDDLEDRFAQIDR